MNRIRINPGDTVPLFLDEREWHVIRHEVLLSEELEACLQQASSKKEGMCVPLTLLEVDELTAVAQDQSEHAPDESRRKIWNNLFARLHTMLDTYTDGEEEFWQEFEEKEIFGIPGYIDGEKLPLGLENCIEEAMKKCSGKSLQEVNAAIENARRNFNRQSQSDLGGLTPEQIYNLIYSTWDDPQCPMKLNPALSIDELQQAPIFFNTRVLLHTLLELDGKSKTTETGNLSRKFVKLMFDRLRMPKDDADDIRRMCKVINETDVWPLHIARILLEMAGYVKIRTKEISITAKGKKMLRDDQAGAYYAHLFQIFFWQLNLAYLDRSFDNPALQTTIAYSFFQISHQAVDWIDEKALSPQIILPPVREQIDNERFPFILPLQIYCRILQPLYWFGLLSIRDKKGKEKELRRNMEIQKTPLFDRFLQFEF